MSGHTDYCLRAENEAALRAALPWALVEIDGQQHWQTDSADWCLVLIGAIGADSSFHANLRCAPGFAPEIAPELIITPDTQSVVFA